MSDPRPPQTPGHTMMKIGTTFGAGVYAGNNKPHFNLWDAEKDPKFAGQNVVQDDHMWAQAIWGYEKNLPPYDPERQRTLPRRHGRVVGDHEGADSPQHRDGGGLHVERRGRCVCARRRRGTRRDLRALDRRAVSRSAAISSRRCWNNRRSEACNERSRDLRSTNLCLHVSPTHPQFASHSDSTHPHAPSG